MDIYVHFYVLGRVGAQSVHTTARKDEGLCWVHGDGSQIVGVGLKLVNPLQSVVVVDSDMHVVLGGGILCY